MAREPDRAVRWIAHVTRAGWLAKGFLFLTIGVLALRIATHPWDTSDPNADQTGALYALAARPVGALLLVLVSLGLVVFMVWNMTQAIVPRSTGFDPLGICIRFGWFGLGLFYGTTAILGFRLAWQRAGADDGLGAAAATSAAASEQGSSDRGPAALTARLLEYPAGRWIAILIGVIVLIVAVYHLRKGVTFDFVDDLDTDGLQPSTRRWLSGLGVCGFAARALMLAIIGYLLLVAAIEFDPSEAVGLDGALRAMASVTFGRILLAVTGIGLAAAGVYDMVTFRRQRLR